ncbi:MAG: choice-of-anchor D domain-containing protein [Deltaproteobacteria bacterium]
MPETRTGMLPTVPTLEVQPPAVDLGAVTTGFASRARVKIINSGAASLPTPQVAWSAGNAADYEIIQNQCQSDVPPGGSCDLRVQLVPSRVGVVEAALEVSSPDGGTAIVPFSAEGLAAGNLILAPAVGSFEDYGGVRVGDTRDRTFSILNPGATPSGGLSVRLNRPEFALLPPQQGDCVPGVTQLAGSEACNLRVAFAPGERGVTESTLTVTAATAGSVSLNLSGSGLIPGVLHASSSTLDFDAVVLGSSGFGSVSFENQGDEPLTLGGARLEPGDVPEFSIQSSNCGAGASLAAGAVCEVGLEFRPTAAGQERAAELVLELIGGEPLRVGLLGRGLESGSLLLAANAPGEEDFGDVLLDQSLTRMFHVTNPVTQPSGVLSLSTSGRFELATPPEAGDCVDGSTSLVNGEHCTVRLSFKPTLRQAEAGALTVASALAGATRLALSGRGILPAKFDAGPEVNFGRVLTNATAERVITVKNAGDQALPPPTIEVLAGSSAQAAAFSFVSTCTTALAFAEQCRITVTFDPTDPVPHSANLKLSAEPGGSATVLLLGEALTPGSLVLPAASDGSADFGDVPIGTTVNRSFMLSNPGNVASGRLTLSTDDSHFLVDPGDCNEGAPEGLVDGSSCTFRVAFTPSGSDSAVANVSVQSSGAGRAGLEIRGRGRSSALLTAATGNRDLGRANIGRPPTAANQFTWTISNGGDLPSGALRLTRGSVTEFQISNDTCSNAQLAGNSSCQMLIRFVPVEPPGARRETIVVTDTTTSRAVTLTLTGVSVRVAAPGQSCINAECAQGVCTDGVCCDKACDSTCQQCSLTGTCADQSSQEQCGNGNARCFGVNQCLLPAGQACGADSDCGGGLQCKQCLTGGRQCTPAATCCGGCPGSQSCVNGSCACTAQQIDCGGGLCIPRNQANVCCPGSPQCPANLPACTSDGRCVACLTNSQCGPCSTCNTSTNTCAPRARGTAGVCTGQQLCDGSGACFNPACGATGAPACGDCRVCQDFQCRAATDGTLCTQNGRCNASGQCVAAAPAALTTVTAPTAFPRTLVGEIAGVQRTWTVRNSGSLATVGTLQSANTNSAEFPLTGNCLGQGLAAGASCALGVSFAPGAPGPRSARLRLNAGGTVFVEVTVSGDARLASGEDCPSNRSLCDSGSCTEWFVDVDGDGFGSTEAVGGHPAKLICGDGSAANRPNPFVFGQGCRGSDVELPYVNDPAGRTDCCDDLVSCSVSGVPQNFVFSNEFFPGRTEAIRGFGTCGSDFNCDGTPVAVEQPAEPQPACGAMPNAISAGACSLRSGFTVRLECGVPSAPQVCGLLTTGVCGTITGVAATLPLCL